MYVSTSDIRFILHGYDQYALHCDIVIVGLFPFGRRYFWNINNCFLLLLLLLILCGFQVTKTKPSNRALNKIEIDFTLSIGWHSMPFLFRQIIHCNNHFTPNEFHWTSGNCTIFPSGDLNRVFLGWHMYMWDCGSCVSIVKRA